MSERIGSIVIEAVEPELDAGRYAVKRVVGEAVSIQADVFKEGHDILAPALRVIGDASLGKDDSA